MNEAVQKLVNELDCARDKAEEARVTYAGGDGIDDELLDLASKVSQAHRLSVGMLNGQTLVVPTDAPDNFDRVITEALDRACAAATKPLVLKLEETLKTAEDCRDRLMDLVDITGAAKELPDLLREVRGALNARPAKVSLQLGWTFWFAFAIAAASLAAWKLGLVGD